MFSFGALQKTDTGYVIPIPKYSSTSTQTFTWVGNDLRRSVLSLLRNYSDPTKNILGKAFPVVTAIMTYPEVAKKISAGRLVIRNRKASIPLIAIQSLAKR